MICRQGDHGDRVYVNRGGVIEIRHDDGDGIRTIARRATGHLVGERAAFEPAARSATMVAVGPVTALVIETGAFTAFLELFPQVVKKIEGGLYRRMTEQRPAETYPLRGQYRPILMADISSFNDPERTNLDRIAIRQVLYSELKHVLIAAGVPWGECHVEDRGDGALLIATADTIPGALLERLPEELAEALASHNAGASPGRRLAVRLAVGIGPVIEDPWGVVGEQINLTARLLDAPEFKAEMIEGVCVGVVVSTELHETVARHLPDRDGFHEIDVRVKETRTTAWARTLSP
ncbi:hypothetical protein GCM10027589_01840 [Actinocorallia lasiicapitis]